MNEYELKAKANALRGAGIGQMNIQKSVRIEEVSNGFLVYRGSSGYELGNLHSNSFVFNRIEEVVEFTKQYFFDVEYKEPR